jgi:hypothetical protein
VSKVIKRVPISEEDQLLVQRTWYELAGLENLVKQFTSDTAYKPNQERYEYVLTKYLEAYAYHDMVFNEVVRKNLGDEMFEKHRNDNIVVSFIDSEIIISEKQVDAVSCGCSSLKKIREQRLGEVEIEGVER